MTILNCGGNPQGGGGLPDPTSASAGDVLTLDNNKDAVWQTPSGGSGFTKVHLAWGQATYADVRQAIFNMKQGDIIHIKRMRSETSSGNDEISHYFGCCTQKMDVTNETRLTMGWGGYQKSGTDRGTILLSFSDIGQYATVITVFRYSSYGTTSYADYIQFGINTFNADIDIIYFD